MLVATTRDNVSPSLVLELLRRVGGIIKVLFSKKCDDTGPICLSVSCLAEQQP